MTFLSKKPSGAQKGDIEHCVFGHFHRPDLGAIKKVPHKEFDTGAEEDDQTQSGCRIEHYVDDAIENGVKSL
jgi:hypothetical protein